MRDLELGALPVPELGPLLGRVGDPAPRGPVSGEGSPALDAVRYDLVTELYAQARAARVAWRAGRESEAAYAIGREVWVAAFRAAAAAAAHRCLAVIEARCAAAAAARMPRRLLAARLPTAAHRRGFATRCESAGIPIEELPPLRLDREPAEWFRRAGMALDLAWDRLERVVRDELAGWEPEIAALAAWRPRRAARWVITALALAAATALGLSLGGYLPAPGPLAVLRDWWWETVPAWP